MSHPTNSTTNVSEVFCCGICHSAVAFVVQPGGDLTYQCQNERCQKVVMVECPEALALVEDVTAELPDPCEVITTTRLRAVTSSGLRRGIKERTSWPYSELTSVFDATFDLFGASLDDFDDPAGHQAYAVFLQILKLANWTRRRWDWVCARDARQAN